MFHVAKKIESGYEASWFQSDSVYERLCILFRYDKPYKVSSGKFSFYANNSMKSFRFSLVRVPFSSLKRVGNGGMNLDQFLIYC